MAQILSINISDKTGVMKKPVQEAELVEGGIRGDAHCGLSDTKQISLLADESAEKIRNAGVDVKAGSFAENITTKGIKLNALPVGTRLQIGQTLHEVSQIGKECHHGCAIKQQAGACVMPTEGIFTRVLQGGKIYTGDAIQVVEPAQ